MFRKSTYRFDLFVWLCVVILSILSFACNNQVPVDEEVVQEKYVSPISLAGLQARAYQTELKFVKELDQTSSYQASLYQYMSDSLNIYAMVSKPVSAAPSEGYPVLIFGHGFHPEPKKYGISNTTGEEWRPGDYYRTIPETYAAEGFLVVTPDYRGHNKSDGFEFTKKKYIASNFYTIDVLNLLAGISSLKQVNLNQIFYLGHSMGGDVGLRMLLVSNHIKAASLWSAVLASTTEQALYYGHFYDESKPGVDKDIMVDYTMELNQGIASLGFDYTTTAGDPIYFIDELEVPLMIQHARGDQSVPYAWSESLAAKLFELNKPFEFYSYTSSNHLFKDENFDLAVQRDVAFFKQYTN